MDPGRARRPPVVDTCLRPGTIRRGDLSAALRGVSRAACRRPDSRPQRAGEHAEHAHSAHARLRRDDDHRVSVEPRRAGSGRRDSSVSQVAIPPRVQRRSAPIAPSRSTPAASPIWNGWSPSAEQLALRAGSTRQAHRRSGVAAEVEMGIWLRRRYLRVRAADGHRQPGVHRQRRRGRACAARGYGLPAVDVSGCGLDSIGDRGCARRRQAGAAFRRSHGVVLRSRCGDGKRSLAQATRGARSGSLERAARRRRWRRVCRGLVVGRITRAEPGVPMLHLPRKRHCSARS